MTTTVPWTAGLGGGHPPGWGGRREASGRWPLGGEPAEEWWLDGELGVGVVPDWVWDDGGWDQAGGDVPDDEQSWDAPGMPPAPAWVEDLGPQPLPGWVFEEVDLARFSGLGYTDGAAGSAAARLAAVEAAGLTPVVDAWMLDAAGGGSVADYLGAAADVAGGVRRLEGLEGRLVASAARVREAEGGTGWSAVEEHALGAHLTSFEAQGLARAGQAGLDHPEVREAQESGDLSNRSCLTILTAAGRVGDEDSKRRVVEAGLRFARSFDWKHVRSAVDQIAAHIDPEANNRAAGQERDNRSVRLQPKPHGMAELTAYGPAVDLRLVTASIEAQARAQAGRDKQAGSSRTQAQREFDLLCRPWLIDGPASELAAGFDAPATVTELTARPHLLIAVEAGTLAGLSDAPAKILGGDGQSLPVRDAWVLAAETTWQTVLTEAGRLVALCPNIHEPATWPIHVAVSRGYKPSAGLKYAVEVKDQACLRCGAPAARAEFDHRVPYPQGPTSGLNGQLLCKRCHELKTHHGWQHTHNPDTGVTTVRTPTGHTQRHTTATAVVRRGREPSGGRPTRVGREAQTVKRRNGDHSGVPKNGPQRCRSPETTVWDWRGAANRRHGIVRRLGRWPRRPGRKGTPAVR